MKWTAIEWQQNSSYPKGQIDRAQRFTLVGWPVNYAAGRFCILITIPFRECIPGLLSLSASFAWTFYGRLRRAVLYRIHQLIALIPLDRRSFVSGEQYRVTARRSPVYASLSRHGFLTSVFLKRETDRTRYRERETIASEIVRVNSVEEC